LKFEYKKKGGDFWNIGMFTLGNLFYDNLLKKEPPCSRGRPQGIAPTYCTFISVGETLVVALLRRRMENHLFNESKMPDKKVK
jgi:hypothetical protein